jgi:penicillin-binding protein 1A
MQQYAEEAQQEYMKNLQAQFNDHWRGKNLAKSIHNFKFLVNQGMLKSDRYKQLKMQGLSDEEIKTNFNTKDTLNLFTWHGDIDTLMRPIDSIIYCKMLLRNALDEYGPYHWLC